MPEPESKGTRWALVALAAFAAEALTLPLAWWIVGPDPSWVVAASMVTVAMIGVTLLVVRTSRAPP
jgi:membrane protein YdbS with pleckstrin-like domain